MAKTPPYRIPVPVNEEARHAFAQLAEETNTSIGACMASFLNELAPSILRLAETYKLAKQDPFRAAENMLNQANEAQSSLDKEQIDLVEAINKSKGDKRI